MRFVACDGLFRLFPCFRRGAHDAHGTSDVSLTMSMGSVILHVASVECLNAGEWYMLPLLARIGALAVVHAHVHHAEPTVGLFTVDLGRAASERLAAYLRTSARIACLSGNGACKSTR